MPDAFSELANRMVDTSSEEWRHECEVRHLVDKMTPNQLKGFLEGTSDERGVAHIRGPEAVLHLRAEMARLVEIRRSRR